MPRPITPLLLAACLLGMAAPASAQDDTIKRIQRNPQALILDAARVKAGADMLYLSGQLPSPIDPTKSMAQATSWEDYGDTKTQTISTLAKIKEIVEAEGFAMTDLVKLSLFVTADPRTGKMDFAGVNEGFRTFFKTAENPTTVARSTFEVAGLVGPQFLIEIEAIAARKPAE